MTQFAKNSFKSFDPAEFLAHAGLGRRIVRLKTKGVFFAQGSSADSVFYLQKGRAKLTVVSKAGKEATITLLSAGDFIGEESVAGVLGLRLATATAITPCTALKIERKEMIRAIDEQHALSNIFVAFLLARSMRVQADLIDQLFNSSEKRLARILLLMAEFGQPGRQETLIPVITQETLADMIGTTRSRVSFFMNRFRKLGFIEYNGRIHVNKSLLTVVLHDSVPGQSSVSAALFDTARDKTQAAKRVSAMVSRTEGLERWAGSRPFHLSQGDRRRREVRGDGEARHRQYPDEGLPRPVFPVPSLLI
jgi:CRP/FNR family cyclic AMP-dependent transcriptional regulator